MRRKGNDKGEIVTSCRLSGLIVEKDNEISEKESSSNPARRLCLTYESLDSDLPGLFTLGEKEHVLYHSHIELWFEKQALADIAYESLSKFIRKAKAKRGKNLREYLVKLTS